MKRSMNSLALLWALKDVDKWGMEREKILYREETAWEKAQMMNRPRMY